MFMSNMSQGKKCDTVEAGPAEVNFRVRDTGQLLVCKCTCPPCTGEMTYEVDGQAQNPHRGCVGRKPCSIARHLARASQRAETKTAQAAEYARRTGVIPR